MTQVRKLKIFLASPADVATERRHVKTVIDELNSHVAAAQGVVLEVVSSERARPGFGKDGQSIVNQQIARMSDYDLFIGIMWKRIGTPTLRAKSGTVEEYQRAVRTFKRIGRPEIWFYFRQPATQFKSKEEETQQKEVLKFRARIRSKGLFREYRSPADFAKQLREHLTGWLLKRKSRRQASPTPAITKKRLPTAKATEPNRSSAGSASVRGPGSWILLNDTFFQATSSKTRPDQSILLRISLTSREKIAELRALYPSDSYRRKRVAYADNLEAGIMEVAAVHTESTARATTFEIELMPISYSRGYNLYHSDTRRITTMQVRLLLLGEPLPQEPSLFYPALYVASPDNQRQAVEGPIFPTLWKTLKTPTRLFLPKAWLRAAYDLKMSNLVTDILELRLGPIKHNAMVVFTTVQKRRTGELM